MYNIKRWYGPSDCNDCKQKYRKGQSMDKDNKCQKGLLRAFTKGTIQEKNTLRKRTISRVGHNKEKEIIQQEDIAIEWGKNRYNKVTEKDKL